MSVREQILARLMGVLLNATDAGANVFRSREVSITREMTPALVIMPDAEDDDVFSASIDRHHFIVSLEVFTRGDPWDQLADPVATQSHRLLMTDAVLATLTTRLRKISSKWEGEEADKTAGVLTMKYSIDYFTKATDIADGNIV